MRTFKSIKGQKSLEVGNFRFLLVALATSQGGGHVESYVRYNVDNTTRQRARTTIQINYTYENDPDTLYTQNRRVESGFGVG